MLKNINPLLSGALLTMIDSMEPGEWLTLAGREYSDSSSDAAVVDVGEATMEATAIAILSIMPLGKGEESPIVFLDASAEEGGELPDVAFAIRGIASDAELRRVTMKCFDPTAFAEFAEHSVLTIVAGDDSASSAFLLQKGHC
ncbi:MAG: hypothetical protein EPN48_13595 [Microbacteriaceae bacterium]|nr:MAG: hypothetical protein EPN48_13595 [Microbacteriaceae bacterium]